MIIYRIHDMVDGLEATITHDIDGGMFTVTLRDTELQEAGEAIAVTRFPYGDTRMGQSAALDRALTRAQSWVPATVRPVLEDLDEEDPWQDEEAPWPEVVTSNPDNSRSLLEDARWLLTEISEFDSGPINWGDVRGLADRIADYLGDCCVS